MDQEPSKCTNLTDIFQVQLSCYIRTKQDVKKQWSTFHLKMSPKTSQRRVKHALTSNYKVMIRRNMNCSYVHKAEVHLKGRLLMEAEHMHFVKLEL
jgi:hypothetical protein